MIISNIIPWSDNWWIEGSKAWFIIGAKNVLCCFDMDRNECDVMIEIPERSESKFRTAAFCMKYHDDVFCFPVSGSSIWIYSVGSGLFSEINIVNQHMAGLEMHDFWEYNGKIFVVSIGIRRIFEINTEEKRVENDYALGQGERIARSVKAGTAIYTLSGMFQRIYRFDLFTKVTEAYELPQIGRKYSTICFDEDGFWLGGCRKEICRWNKKENIMDIYDGLFKEDMDGSEGSASEEPDTPLFLQTVTVGKYHWFIPFQMNEIIYVDRQYHKAYKFEIAEEFESKDSILARKIFKAKYILEYVREDRYLGLFSIKNNQIVEIDAETKTYRWCEYKLGDQSIRKCAELVGNELDECNIWDREVFRKIIKMGNHNIRHGESKKVGIDIHREVIKAIE